MGYHIEIYFFHLLLLPRDSHLKTLVFLFAKSLGVGRLVVFRETLLGYDIDVVFDGIDVSARVGSLLSIADDAAEF